tara:strand:- start:546 stop:1661 length:1116 start_codon:yes stop_codon:yes gene_type:complete
MKIKSIAIDKLIPYHNNPRKDQAVDKVASSINEYGFQQPIVVDKNMVVVVGHTRLMGAKKLGLKRVPTVIADLTETQAKAYRIADNRINEDSTWDMELLNLEIAGLSELDFDLDLLGFDSSELDKLLVNDEEYLTDEDEVPEPPKEPKSKLGDVYQLGENRLMCGDSTKVDHVDKLINGANIDLVYTDPPYGINYKSPSGKGMTDRGNYDVIKNDDKEYDPNILFNFCDFIITWGANHYANKLPNSACWLVWDKREGDAINNNSDCELAWVSQGGSARLFHHKWNGMIKKTEKKDKRLHPTQKPIELHKWVFETVSAKNNILDLYGGSGSTMIACEKTNRKCYMMELDPKYVDVIIERWENFTGKKAKKIC